MFDNIISLFDGISCGQIALKRAGIKYNTYYASEIDKYAIKVTQHHFPQTIQLGDVTQIRGENLPKKIDLLMGGSPCQGFSWSGKRLNFNDPRSKLFFEFVRLLKECKPKYWLLENVVMRKDFEQTITSYLEVEPVMINSSLVSAQNRKRLYWANFPITQPIDKGIKLSSILEDTTMLNKATIVGRRLNDKGRREDYNKKIPITQCLEVRASNRDKSNCLTTVAKDTVLTSLPVGRYKDVFNKKLPFRYYTIKEYCRLQTIPDDYFDNIKIPENQVRKLVGNAWTVDVIVHIFKNMLTLL
jgi:DNA (cytosine-5)-methyltransferase 3A